MESSKRFGENAPDGCLEVIVLKDGDIIVAVTKTHNESLNKLEIPLTADITFRTHVGGGNSPKTFSALRALVSAMNEDNAKFPQRQAYDESTQETAP